jgi:hypothetical protein
MINTTLNITHRLVRGPHLLFTGANKHKTYGITIRHLDEAKLKGTAYSVEYNLNDFTMLQGDPSDFLFIGETLDSIKAIRAEILKLSKEQT